CFQCSFLTAQKLEIPIFTLHNALVLQVNENKDIGMIYYGEKLSAPGEYGAIPEMSRLADDYTGMLNAAYTSSGSRNLAEPAIAVTHADGNNSLDLKYVQHEITREEGISLLKILLRDPVYDLEVILHY